VISGYCIFAAAYGALVSGKSLSRYCYERVRRIYPPYFAALILSVLSVLLIRFANAHHLIGEVNHPQILPHGARAWIANLFLLQYELNTPMVNVVFWSLGYEIAFYVMVGLLLQGAKWVAAKRDLHAGTVFFVIATGVSTLLTLGWLLYSGQMCFPVDSWHDFAIGGLLFFFLDLKPGRVANYTASLRTVTIASLAAVTVMTLLLIAFRSIGFSDYAHPSSRVRASVCLGFSALLIVLRPFDEWLSSHLLLKPFMSVGAFSYSLYLVHPVVVSYVDVLGRKAGLNGSLYWITFWAEVAVSLVFGRIFFLLVEKRFISQAAEAADRRRTCRAGV
jgi:peptidoglycan/LPS O-acetylase OafA/YrhL